VEEITKSNENTMKWLQTINAISISKICPCCSLDMHVCKEKSLNDGRQWVCCYQKRRKRLSIRHGTMLLKHDKVPLIILSRLIFIYFSQGINARSVHIFITEQLGNAFEISYKTVKKIYRKL